MGIFVSYTKLPDEALMKRLQNHDIKAFDELYLRYYPKLYGYVLKIMKYDKPVSDDIIQEVFVKVFQYPEKFDINKSFKPWIYTVASNDCRKHYRRKELESIEHIEIEMNQIEKEPDIELSEFITRLNEQLNQVSMEQKEVFMLKHQAGFSLNEIAEIQNCALGTVKSRLHYVTKFLSEKLAPYKQRLLQNEFK